MLPTFIVAGAQKSGSTTIHRVLDAHAQIFVAPEKEVNYFWKRANLEKGTQWYESFFSGAESHQQVGDVSPSYMYRSWSPTEISKLLPHVKLVFSLRNPIERAYSQYWHWRRRLWEPRTFQEAIRDKSCQYVARGQYFTQLKRFCDRFPRHQILVLLFDELVADPKAFFRQIGSFLDVDEFPGEMVATRANDPRWPANRLYQLLHDRPAWTRYVPRVFSGRSLLMRAVSWGPMVPYTYPPMDFEVRRELRDYYTEEIQLTAALIGMDLSHWLG